MSDYFYNTSGLYRAACNYYAYLYRYDWYVVTEIYDQDNMDNKKITKDFYKLLSYLDNSNLKQLCGDIGLAVVKDGAYYGYIVPSGDSLILQQLPSDYCRCRYNVGLAPAVEFNMRFFDEKFPDPEYRLRILKLFPKEFYKGYLLWRQNKIKGDTLGEINSSWYLLEPGSAVKFNFTGNSTGSDDIPPFAAAIPQILDLDAAQDLDRRKQMQKLLKILIQKLPIDKNGDLIFDVDEARDIHNNAVQMLSNSVGVDVLTTFTDVKMADLADNNSATTSDDLEKVERSVYNSLGVSKNLFNPEGNLATTNSILQDESSVRGLLLQIQAFVNRVAQEFSRKKNKYGFRFHMLETTQYNYQALSKMYKDQSQIGCSKVLAQVALGHSQSSILHTAVFENQVLNLSAVMLPPLMSSTLSGEDILGVRGQSNTTQSSSSNEVGRPEKEDSEKSDKTIQNLESQS